MNEPRAIVRAAAAARAAGRAELLLATVVRVRGSAYRRPGARMLLSADGWLAGGISGGCLEGDVLRKAWWRTRDGRAAAVVAYDSTGADEDGGNDGNDGDGAALDALAWGFGLGCSGVVEVLLERLGEGGPACPVEFLDSCLRRRRPGVMATVIAATAGDGGGPVGVGQRLLWHDGDAAPAGSTLGDAALAGRVGRDARRALAAGRSEVATYPLAGGGRADVFLEVVRPPTPLVVCGAGQDAAPLARMAGELGWHVTVVDPRPGLPARPDRFPGADAVLSCAPADLPVRVALGGDTLAVVMSHNVATDGALLAALLPSPVRYVGVLGPRRRTERLLAALRHGGTPLPGLERLHYPVGLDIGAEDPAAVALSVLAEMQAVVAGRAGGFLGDRDLPIHDPAADAVPAAFPARDLTALPGLPDLTAKEPVACALANPDPSPSAPAW